MLFDHIAVTQNTQVMLSLAIILLCGFLFTRFTKKLRLPNVTAYLLAGIAIGPHVLGLIPTNIVDGLDFVTDVALAFIAFGVGRYFKWEILRKSGKEVLVITLLEALGAAVLITLVMYYLFHLSLAFSLLLGAIGSATAPASTIMTIRQYHAKGKFVDLILQVVALDDAVALVAFSVATAVTSATVSGQPGITVAEIALPILSNLLAVAGGLVFGWLLHLLITEKRTSDNALMIAISMILLVAALCSAFEISPLLSCMALGTAFINLSKNETLFTQVESFSPPVLTLFFVLSGMRLDLSSLATAGIIGVVYFLVRIAGKYLGATVGGILCRSQPSVRHFLGMALIPQAGVSIGMAALGQRLLSEETGALLSAIILSSAVLYEMIGPASAKAALILSGSIERQPSTEQPQMVRSRL